MKKSLILCAALSVGGWGLMAGSASALTITQIDDKIYFPDYVSTSPSGSYEEWKDYNVDSIGSLPEVGTMTITINDDTMMLMSVAIEVTDRLQYDTLFINTSVGADFHSWEYLIQDGLLGDNDLYPNKSPIASGLYGVGADYAYTFVDFDGWNRSGHVNGIEGEDLALLDGGFAPTYDGMTLFYDFSQYRILWDKGNSVIGYTQFCANDITYNEVPEPATMLLFGSGLAGLAGAARRRRAAKK